MEGGRRSLLDVGRNLHAAGKPLSGCPTRSGISLLQHGRSYLDNATYFEPLSRGVNVLSDKHAYSYVNALCSAMQAYFSERNPMHLAAAQTGFDMLQNQSFATAGWGPDEVLRKPGYDELAKSLTATHNSFEGPCGSYAHMKLTRQLLRATRDGRYGDSMERMMLNVVRGILPLQPDGRSFYYVDYNVAAKRIYSLHRWPCCSGTFPQVVADYGINTYLQEPGALWVNLYHASTVRLAVNSHSLDVEQTGRYLEDGTVQLRFTCAAPVALTVWLRIPGWAGDGARLTVDEGPTKSRQSRASPRSGEPGSRATWSRSRFRWRFGWSLCPPTEALSILKSLP